MSDEAPTAEAPTDHALGAAPAAAGTAAVPEPSGDGRTAGASGSILGVRDGPATSENVERRFAGEDVQAHEPTAGAKRRKKSTPQSSTQQALEAMHARQHAYTRGISGIGVEPEKAAAKPEGKPEAPRDDAGAMAPVTASAPTPRPTTRRGCARRQSAARCSRRPRPGGRTKKTPEFPAARRTSLPADRARDPDPARTAEARRRRLATRSPRWTPRAKKEAARGRKPTRRTGEPRRSSARSPRRASKGTRRRRRLATRRRAKMRRRIASARAWTG